MCDHCDYEDYINECDEILDDFDNEWCFDTIEGIKKWIEENEHITDRQIEAIENIQRAISFKEDAR